MDPQREYSDSFRIRRIRPTQLSSGFTPLRIQKISGQESPLFKIPGSFQEKTRNKGKEKGYFQKKEEISIPNDPEVVGISEGSEKKQEIIVNKSDRISKPTIRNDIPTKNKQNVVKNDSKMNINDLWLKIAQFLEKTQKGFEKIHEKNSRLQVIITLKTKTIHTPQEDYTKLSKALEETNKRLNKVLEEQNPCKRDKEYLDQDMKKLFNVCQNIKPQEKGHFFDNNTHLQEDIKPDAPIEIKHRSPSKYQYGDSMT
ncbi:hypothetical protein O181_020937 [Austropuccinia psidii MF-1]|uniref:Uncharacterized protein n=1 Tax=Austropuccinia psidii MF-1 TaxID=1389203 RepID=A0A9Q3CCL3_9BASI|nr:hypothetical protein [Austropuccinia psidii MF-1]